MNLTINGKEYALHFGMDFIDEVEKLEGMKMEAEGVSLNMGTGGMALLNNKLASYHPSGLRTVIKAGTTTERQKDRKSTRLNSSHWLQSRMPSSA